MCFLEMETEPEESLRHGVYYQAGNEAEGLDLEERREESGSDPTCSAGLPALWPTYFSGRLGGVGVQRVTARVGGWDKATVGSTGYVGRREGRLQQVFCCRAGIETKVLDLVIRRKRETWPFQQIRNDLAEHTEVGGGTTQPLTVTPGAHARNKELLPETS